MDPGHSDFGASSEYWPSVSQNFYLCAGILNLMVIVLLATNFRLILENLLKYGILTAPTRWIFFLVSDSKPPMFFPGRKPLVFWVSASSRKAGL